MIGVALTKEGIPVRCWSVPGNARLVSALLDRLTHRCHVLQFQAESYRFRESLGQPGLWLPLLEPVGGQRLWPPPAPNLEAERPLADYSAVAAVGVLS